MVGGWVRLGVRSGQFTANDFSTLSRTGAAGSGKGVVRNRTEKLKLGKLKFETEFAGCRDNTKSASRTGQQEILREYVDILRHLIRLSHLCYFGYRHLMDPELQRTI